jgi:cGMP-dependent protein kinase
MQKARVVEMCQQRNVVMERNLMLKANHPYILKLYRTFRDRDCVYMLLEFCQGVWCVVPRQPFRC